MKNKFYINRNIFIKSLYIFIIVSLFLLDILHLKVELASYIFPSFSITVIYFLALNAEEFFFSVKWILCFSMIIEIIKGDPIGYFTILNAIFYFILISQKRFLAGKKFYITFLGFSLFSFLYYFYQFAFFYLLNNILIKYIFLKWLMTIFIYPFVHIILFKTLNLFNNKVYGY